MVARYYPIGISAKRTAAAALWNVWYYRHLNPALGNILTGDAEAPASALDTQTSLKLLGTLEGQAVAVTSLRDATGRSLRAAGHRREPMAGGDLHQIAFAHPLLIGQTRH